MQQHSSQQQSCQVKIIDLHVPGETSQLEVRAMNTREDADLLTLKGVPSSVDLVDEGKIMFFFFAKTCRIFHLLYKYLIICFCVESLNT